MMENIPWLLFEYISRFKSSILVRVYERKVLKLLVLAFDDEKVAKGRNIFKRVIIYIRSGNFPLLEE